MPISLLHIDAFTDRPFAGNPAAVCLLPEPADERWMQDLATELNLSETAYLTPLPDPAGPTWSLRWFTPTVEVDLCGHATLAAAHALVHEHGVEAELLRFSTRSGILPARVVGEGRYELDFPADPVTPTDPLPGLLEGLRVDPATVVSVARGRTDAFVVLATPEAVVALSPDHTVLRDVPVRGVVVTAAGGPGPDGAGVDCTSRFFAPGSGIDEDPVTGSAHCLVGPWWGAELDRTTLVAHQASARGGLLHLTLDGDRVRMAGDAVTVLRATLEPAAS